MLRLCLTSLYDRHVLGTKSLIALFMQYRETSGDHFDGDMGRVNDSFRSVDNDESLNSSAYHYVSSSIGLLLP
jgi:hypothetical protein